MHSRPNATACQPATSRRGRVGRVWLAVALGVACLAGASPGLAGHTAPQILTGPQKMLVIGCAMRDDSIPVLNRANAGIQALMAGVDDYFTTQSNRRITIQGDWAGWWPLPKTTSEYQDLHDAGGFAVGTDCGTNVDLAAALRGTSPNDYDIIVELMSADIGMNNHNNGGTQYVYLRFRGGKAGWQSLSTWAHEIGHTFGLQHSPPGDYNPDVTYTNPYDVMSGFHRTTTTWWPFDGMVCNAASDSPSLQCEGTTGHLPQDLAAFQKDRLGWLNPATEVVTQTYGSANYDLTAPQYNPIGQFPNVRLVKVPFTAFSTAAYDNYYAIEYRRTPVIGDSDDPALAQNWSKWDRGLPSGDRVLIYRVDPSRANTDDLGNAVLLGLLPPGGVWAPTGIPISVHFDRLINGLRMAAAVRVVVPNDVTPPATSLRTANGGQPGTWSRPEVVSLAASDDKAGVAATWYGLDAPACAPAALAACTRYTSPFALDGEGIHTLTYFSVDNAGNAEAPLSTTWYVDATPPTPGASVPTAGGSYARGAQVAVHYVCDDAGGSGVATCGGSVPEGGMLDTAALGAHTITATATDHAGNSTSRAIAYTVRPDRSAPTITVASPAAAGRYAKRALIAAAYTCQDDVAVASCTGTVAVGASIDTAATGTHRFTVKAKDAAGNAATKTVTYTVVADGTRPTITVTAPAAGGRYAQHAPVAAHYACQDGPNGSGVASCTGPVADGASLDTATLGTRTFSVTARDRAGNVATKTVTYVVVPDTTAPTATISTPADGGFYFPFQLAWASFACDDEAGGSGVTGCTATLDGVPLAAYTAPSPTGGLIGLAGIGDLSSGTHAIQVTATDASGNAGTATSTFRVF